jgi:hypothetical protein
MKNKRGQFYLIMSIVIVTLIIGIVVVSNYVNTKPAPKIYDLKNELNIELEKVFDNKIYSGEDHTEEFAREFSKYVGSTTTVYFVFSTTSSVNAFYYEDDTKVNLVSSKTGNQVNVIADGITYQFEDLAKENFHFIIVENINDEIYVVTS